MDNWKYKEQYAAIYVDELSEILSTTYAQANLKTSLTSLLASSIIEEANILLNSPQGSGRTNLSSSHVLLKPYLKSGAFK